jgi:hypothetical protein
VSLSLSEKDTSASVGKTKTNDRRRKKDEEEILIKKLCD